MNCNDFNYADTDSIHINTDCDFCRNAHTCEELSHNNDWTYIPRVRTLGKTVRMMFRSGDKRNIELIVEHFGRYGWETIAILTPHYCLFCGRKLLENKVKGDNTNE